MIRKSCLNLSQVSYFNILSIALQSIKNKESIITFFYRVNRFPQSVPIFGEIIIQRNYYVKIIFALVLLNIFCCLNFLALVTFFSCKILNYKFT